MNSLVAMLEQARLDAPQQHLFECPGRPAISYDSACGLVQRLAAVLRAQGVNRGDRVAVQVEKSPEAVLLYLACLRIGAIFLPLNAAYTDTEIDYFMADAEPALFVCRPEESAALLGRYEGSLRIETMSETGAGTLLDRATDVVPMNEIVTCEKDDPAAILYTSGTTGRPKGAVLTHGNLVPNTEALAEAWRYSAADRLIHALPIFHTHGLFVACNLSIATGASMIFLPRFDPDTIIELMDRATVLMGVPTFYTRLLQCPGLTRAAASKMRLFVSGSAPLTEETSRTFAERTGHRILERYGMTETCMIASNPYDGERRPGAVGFPLRDTEVRVTDRESGRAVERGDIGMIEVRGPNVFQGYWRLPEKTAAEFTADGFFRTGDLGRFDADGYLAIAGRDKDLVISGGYNIYPKEVERVLDAISGIEESAVFGVPHPDMGEAVVAAVVVGHTDGVDPDEVIDAMKTHLARYKLPRRVFLIDRLPRNAMGKVQKNELRRAYADVFIS